MGSSSQRRRRIGRRDGGVGRLGLRIFDDGKRIVVRLWNRLRVRGEGRLRRRRCRVGNEGDKDDFSLKRRVGGHWELVSRLVGQLIWRVIHRKAGVVV